jgi:hypothetical protein
MKPSSPRNGVLSTDDHRHCRSHRSRQDQPGSRLDRRRYGSAQGRKRARHLHRTRLCLFTVAGGETLGFIDVPGHERLVHTMVAGAGGIDFALLVIAADDGVMPQTREHLAILDLMGVRRGAVAISKIDRVAETRSEGWRRRSRPCFPPRLCAKRRCLR